MDSARARHGGAIRGVFLALGLVLAAGSASAASKTCSDLEAKLSNLPATASAMAARYDRAITVQQSELQAARVQSRKAGCGFAIFPGRVAECGRLAATVDRMEANLADLQQKRARMGGGDSRRERARLMAAIEVNGCRGTARPQQVVITSSSGTVRYGEGGPAIAPGGQYRTMCVRACDGYFFPIEQASTAQQFPRDQQKCESLCPGTKVELYYHSPQQEASEMMSAATGLAYAQQPFAFRYRDASYRKPESCGCNATASPREFSIIAGEQQPQESGPTEAILPRPEFRPDPAIDPESYANRKGGLDQASVERLLPKPATPKALQSDEDRAVRVVGPTFLPGPEEAIDLRAPVPTTGP